jgi:hypothetical protein
MGVGEITSFANTGTILRNTLHPPLVNYKDRSILSRRRFFLDMIIDHWWRTLCESVESLAKTAASFSGAIDLPRAPASEDRCVAEKRLRCKCGVVDGLLQCN